MKTPVITDPIMQKRKSLEVMRKVLEWSGWQDMSYWTECPAFLLADGAHEVPAFMQRFHCEQIGIQWVIDAWELTTRVMDVDAIEDAIEQAVFYYFNGTDEEQPVAAFVILCFRCLFNPNLLKPDSCWEVTEGEAVYRGTEAAPGDVHLPPLAALYDELPEAYQEKVPQTFHDYYKLTEG